MTGAKKLAAKVALNAKKMKDGDVIVVRCGGESDNADDVILVVNSMLEEHNPDADVAVIVLRPGDNIELLSEKDMNRFGWMKF